MHPTIDSIYSSLSPYFKTKAIEHIAARIRFLGFNPVEVIETGDLENLVVCIWQLMSVDALETYHSASEYMINVTTLTADRKPAIIFNM